MKLDIVVNSTTSAKSILNLYYNNNNNNNNNNDKFGKLLYLRSDLHLRSLND